MPTYAAVIAAEGPGGLFATLDANRLIIRCAETRTLLRKIELTPKFAATVRHMRWYTGDDSNQAENPVQRLLIANNEDVQIHDVRNARWQANLKKVCGNGGKIASVDFGAHGDEIIAFGAFGLKACVWSLETGRATEIRDPKSPHAKAHSLRPRSGHLAILTRPATKDVITVLSLERNEVECSFNTPTVDAQGVKWSPDGRWMVTWDTATAGTGVIIYTATGQVFKRLTGGEEDLGYGVQRVEWTPDSKHLIVMMNDGKAVQLEAKTFQPVAALEYPSRVASQHAQIYEERLAGDGTRAYGPALHPIMPPTTDALGFNFAAPSPCQNLFACVSAKVPTTVWIHRFQPMPQLTAVLVHHGMVKNLSWHSSGLLLIQCSDKGPGQVDATVNSCIYVWGDDIGEPRVVTVPVSPIGKVAWMQCAEPRVLAGGASSCSVVAVLSQEDEDVTEHPTPKPALAQKQRFAVEATPTQVLGYEMETPMGSATSSFSPIRMDTQQLTKTLGFQFTSLSETDDTFDYKRNVIGR